MYVFFIYFFLNEYVYLNILINRVVIELLGDLRNYFGCLYKLFEVVFMIDMLQSFVYVCILFSYGIIFDFFVEKLKYMQLYCYKFDY